MESHTRFIISAAGRDGSTLLQTSLNAHPNIVCQGELIRSQEDWPKVRQMILEYQQPKVGGFKLLHYQAKFLKDTDFLSIIRQYDTRIVFLYRQNTLEQYCSHRIAQITQKWRTYDRKLKRTETINIEVAKAVAWMNMIRNAYDRAKEQLSEFPLITVRYEELNNNFQVETDKVCEFLGVSAVKLPQVTQKLEERPLAEIIENYDEIRTALRGSEYESCLQG